MRSKKSFQVVCQLTCCSFSSPTSSLPCLESPARSPSFSCRIQATSLTSLWLWSYQHLFFQAGQYRLDPNSCLQISVVGLEKGSNSPCLVGTALVPLFHMVEVLQWLWWRSLHILYLWHRYYYWYIACTWIYTTGSSQAEGRRSPSSSPLWKTWPQHQCHRSQGSSGCSWQVIAYPTSPLMSIGFGSLIN